jgi:molybdate transport system substrate-binding protein
MLSVREFEHRISTSRAGVVYCALPALALCIACERGQADHSRELSVCCGAGLIKPVEDLRTAFERSRGVRVVVNYAGAGELMAQMEVKQRCDVFVPGARKYVEDARARGWVDEETIRDLVLHVPAIAVPRGNPAQIEGLADLGRPGVEVAVGDPAACAVGQVALKIFERNGIADKVRANVQVMAPTVNQLLLYVALAEVDAAIIWQDMAAWPERQGKLSIIEIPPEQNVVKMISTAVATNSDRGELARAFNDFMRSAKGHRVWKKWGFVPCND